MSIASELYQTLVNRGVKPAVAVGAVASAMGESGRGLNPNSINRGDGSDGSDSIGFYQANGSRAALIRSKAQEQGTTWNDPKAQLAALNTELDTTHRHVLNGLLKGNTEADGVNTWTRKFEVPGDPDGQVQIRLGKLGEARAAVGDTSATAPAGPAPAGSPATGAPGGLLGTADGAAPGGLGIGGRPQAMSFDDLQGQLAGIGGDTPEPPAGADQPAANPAGGAAPRADLGDDAGGGGQNNWQEQSMGRNAYADKMAALQSPRRGLLGGDGLNNPDILTQILQQGGPAALRGLLG